MLQALAPAQAAPVAAPVPEPPPPMPPAEELVVLLRERAAAAYADIDSPDEIRRVGAGLAEGTIGAGAEPAFGTIDEAVDDAAGRMLAWLDVRAKSEPMSVPLNAAIGVCRDALRKFLEEKHDPRARVVAGVAQAIDDLGVAEAKPSPLRGRTIEQLPADRRPQMNDPRVDDEGHFPNPTRVHVPFPTSLGELDVYVVQDNAGDWLNGYRVKWKVPGIPDLDVKPRVGLTRFNSKDAAVVGQVASLVAQAKHPPAGLDEAARNALAAFVRAMGPVLKRYEQQAEAAAPVPRDELAAGGGFRPQTKGQWMATFRGCIGPDVA